MEYTLPQLLKAVVDQGASDLHLSPGTPPRLRVQGQLLSLELPPLMPQDTRQLCYSILTEEQKKDFETNKEIDLAFSVKGLARFRANVYIQRGSVAGAFRLIPFKIMQMADLGLPSIVADFCRLPRGLILVTGSTGCGKSTTLAAMIDYINETRHDVIITLEDPIEFMHPHKSCLVNQREIGDDTLAYSRALRSALRQDPNVMMVGELRDLETIALAVTMAETGHLIIGTLHTNSAVSTLNRMIDVFPPHQQTQIRTQISFSLMGTISQVLIPTINGKRVAAFELMVPNQAIRNMIREDKIHLIYSQMQSGQDASGMITMNQSLANLVEKRIVSIKMAVAKSPDPEELEAILEKRNIAQLGAIPKKLATPQGATFGAAGRTVIKK